MALEKAKAEMVSQFKVLLLGSCDSGKSTILNQMRLIHNMPFSGQELRSYRQIVFDNLIRGLKYLLDALPNMDLRLPSAYTHVYPEDDPQGRGGYVQGWAPGECGGMNRIGDGLDEEGVRANELQQDVDLIESAPHLCDGESFPLEYLGYFFSDLHRLFDPAYVPTEQDILHTRTRTKGITKTTFKLKHHEILMIDWIHCFQDVTSIVFFASLSWYDQSLVGDRDANQMQDAMTFWDSICHSKWFQRASIILVLTKNDIFEEKIKTSDIRTFFPDFASEPGNAVQGYDFFKKRFSRLGHKAGRVKSREIYILRVHLRLTDTELLRVIMATIEE
ncbi:guanine nucleotide binding protein, alpha subunit [Mycena galopus ATCC 62051]|nr:guanine nucleotide binding protein, alpha subunit [Mycena galopus ATCC 62051]